MGAENWMKAGCVALLPSVEIAMIRGQNKIWQFYVNYYIWGQNEILAIFSVIFGV